MALPQRTVYFCHHSPTNKEWAGGNYLPLFEFNFSGEHQKKKKEKRTSQRLSQEQAIIGQVNHVILINYQ